MSSPALESIEDSQWMVSPVYLSHYSVSNIGVGDWQWRMHVGYVWMANTISSLRDLLAARAYLKIPDHTISNRHVYQERRYIKSSKIELPNLFVALKKVCARSNGRGCSRCLSCQEFVLVTLAVTLTWSNYPPPPSQRSSLHGWGCDKYSILY